MTLLKITLFYAFGAMQYIYAVRGSKNIILHILYIIVAPLCPAFLKRIHFYKALHSEK